MNPEIREAIEKCVAKLPELYQVESRAALYSAWKHRESDDGVYWKMNSSPTMRVTARWQNRVIGSTTYWLCSCDIIEHSSREVAKYATGTPASD